MKILPVVSSGEVFMHEDGTIELVAFQVFKSDSHTIIRIGRNTYWFDEKGAYDGPEMKMPRSSPLSTDDVDALLREARENLGKAPNSAYFQEGSKGHHHETSGWPIDGRPVAEHPKQILLSKTFVEPSITIIPDVPKKPKN